jgi:hypothetical protein
MYLTKFHYFIATIDKNATAIKTSTQLEAKFLSVFSKKAVFTAI